MAKNVKQIVESINIDKIGSISGALDQIEKLKKLTGDEKRDLATALSSIFYFDHASKTDMAGLNQRVEKQLVMFGDEILSFLIEELANADTESATHLGKVIAGIGDSAIDKLINVWDENREDDFAIINFMQALSSFRSTEIIKVMPKILDAATARNFQVRAMALYTIKRLVSKLPAASINEEMRSRIFETAFNLLPDGKPLVRKNAVNTLGKFLKKGILEEEQKKKVFNAFASILGNDEKHEWDSAFIVRQEAERFIPYCKISEVHANRYRQSFRIMSKRKLCEKTFHFTIEVPMVTQKLQAGQFIIVRPHKFSERIPLSVCAWDKEQGTIQIIVTAVGKTSTEINNMEVNDCFTDVVGPLGNRSHVKKHDGTCVVIGGGYGTGAIIPTAGDFKELGNRVIGIVGARTKDLLIMIDELNEVCDEVLLTTNDGSEGREGVVTDVLAELIKRETVAHVLAVGPVPMMKAVSEMTKPAGIETFVSLNAIVVDGTGMCGACRVTVGGETKFACFHGPDFNGHEVDFKELMKRQKMFAEAERKAFEEMFI